ncbi:putative O-methyltransferase YrrM [Sedimentibacter acidaminivorans]|jgi:predicted O-methyltransferase YrrM|uniref:tRNA 5-hydroxyuridine methyltransferase n=1 Tax=Sedimentibacter acidaminivorans TaxID=913099 RepID=A0ABS4GBD6_9FIRM|nr:O-methyltransferase [Sedimentibacter acidaminivorans]MBP1924982.1 putative O-methyltransferase YrrM [Sedimentibacter acidaminivorans]
MDNINREYIDVYINSLIENRDEELEKFRLECVERQLPIIHKEVGQFIKLIINQINAKNIIEVGTNVGYSSIFMSHVMNNEGRIVTLERSEKFYKEAIENIKKYNLDKNIEVFYGDAVEILDNINIDGFFDLAFIDAAKSYYTTFFDKCSKMMKSGGIIISDNVLYQGMIATDDLVVRRKKTLVRNMREYLDYISHDDRYITSILPLGDGLAVTLIK